ncbi:MAG: hypothetical protein IMX01_07185 [Limnochordaceae bacterium]|nr:hypothetical protein [Limnochordaceae bacterium]
MTRSQQENGQPGAERRFQAAAARASHLVNALYSVLGWLAGPARQIRHIG